MESPPPAEQKRKPYSKPQLKRYGTLADVTQAAGFISMNSDNGGGMGRPTKSA